MSPSDPLQDDAKSEDKESEMMIELKQVREEYANLQAAHSALLERIQSDVDHTSRKENEEMVKELQSMRERVKELEGKVESVTAERDELNSTVRDLRVRVEESRRAIMRLQGQSASSNGNEVLLSSSAASSVSNLAGLAAGSGQRRDSRRSVGPSILASWNPRETMNGSASLNVVSDSAFDTMTDGKPFITSSINASPENADLKKSKRASLAFGPHAQGSNTMRRMHGHRRIASGSRIGQDDDDSTSMPPPSTPLPTAGGLRELQLGGPSASGTSTLPASNPDRSSKRISIMSGNYRRSPIFDAADLSPEESPDRTQPAGSLLMPSKSSRRASNSSGISNGGGIALFCEDTENNLAPPRSLSRLSHSPSQASASSPIQEAPDGLEDGESEPRTARANQAAVGSVFGAQQAQNSSLSSYQIQRSLMESKARLRDRDDQITLLKRELNALKMQLDEAKDSRDASEACLTALREFVKADGGGQSENGGEQTFQALKGIKLPPLPTDKETDDLEGSEDYNVIRSSVSTAPSAWRSLGNPFSGLTRKQTDTNDMLAQSPKLDNIGDNVQDPSASSPTAQITSSFSNLWNRATAKADPQTTGNNGGASGNTEGISGSSVTQSEGTSGEGQTDSRHTSIASVNGIGEPGNLTSPGAASAAFKGFNWFGKRTVSSTSEAASSTSGTAEVRVSSPPFANLDNHVLTLDQVNLAPALSAGGRAASYASLTGTSAAGTQASRKTSMTSNTSSGGLIENKQEPNGRVRKAMEKSEAVDEDNGFVPPSFTS